MDSLIKKWSFIFTDSTTTLNPYSPHQCKDEYEVPSILLEETQNCLRYIWKFSVPLDKCTFLKLQEAAEAGLRYEQEKRAATAQGTNVRGEGWGLI